METQINKSSSPHALIWIVAIAVTLFCFAGIAAFMGWIPNSIGGTRDNVVVEKPPVVAAKPVVTTEKHVTHKTTETHTAPVHTAPVHIASNAPVTKARCDECGVIESMREIDTKGTGSGIGGVGGAVVGGLLGNQVGNGRGKDAMTVVGAVGGALAGNEIEKRVKATKTYEVTVRFEDGSTRVINEGNTATWHTGDKVRVVNGVIQSNS